MSDLMEVAEAVAARCVRDCGDATLQLRGQSWEQIIAGHVYEALHPLLAEREKEIEGLVFRLKEDEHYFGERVLAESHRRIAAKATARGSANRGL